VHDLAACYIPARLALLVYSATAVLLLWLVHRFVLPLSRSAAIFLFLVPFALAGHALIANRAFGPIDAIYIGEPLNAIRDARRVGPPHNLATTDIYTQMIPWRHVVRESLLRGEWPLWNPYILSGDILAAAGQPAVYSPFTLIACILPAPLSFTFTVAITFLIAAIGAFTFARELGCRESAAAIAAVGWTYCSSLALYVLWPHGCWAYLPLVLLATHRIVHEPGVRSWAFLTTSLTLLMLAGHPETVMHIVTLSSFYGLFSVSLWFKKESRTTEAQRTLRVIGLAFAAGIITLLLSAIYLLPMLEAIPQSAEYPWRQMVSNSDVYETPLEVKVSVLTNFFPFLHIRRWIEPGPAGLKAETAAVGSVILALAIYGVWRIRSRVSWFFTAFAVVCLIVHSAWRPVASLLKQIPLFDLAINVRLGFGAAFAFALLAALGVEELLRREDRRAAAVTLASVLVILAAGTVWITQSFVIAPPGNWGHYRMFSELFFLGLATLALFVRAPMRVLAPLLVIIIIAQRVTSEGGVHKSFPMSAAYPPMKIFEPMKEIEGPALSGAEGPFRVIGQGLSFIPGMSAFYGLEDARGYEAITLSHYFRTYPLWCEHQSYFINRVHDITKPFVSLLNVRFAFAGEWLPVPQGWRLVAQQGHVILLENMNVIERAFVPRNVKLGLTDEQALEEMKSVSDFRERAWITSDAAIERANGPGTVTIRRTAHGEFQLTADMQGDGWIVLTESAWKGWRAYLDGRRVTIQRANVAFHSIYVPKGKHAIRFVYWPESFVIGRTISFGTLLLVIVFGVWQFRLLRTRKAFGVR
jgi:hypothetical protein